MIMNKIAFLTVLYPINDSIVDLFFNSLVNQTNKSFDIIIVNDGFSDIEHFKEKYCNLNIIEIKNSNNIAKNRELLIRFAIEKKYEIAVFGDIDDYFESNRVEISTKFLNSYDIVVNDLITFGIEHFKEKIISKRIENLSTISINYIVRKNIFGLSNTAINLKGLHSKDIVFPSDLIAVDWYFYSNLLLSGKKAIFTNETLTYYRQYENNTIGIGNVSEKNILKSIEVKLIHYRYMKEKSEIFRTEFSRIERLSYRLNSDHRLLDIACRNTESIQNPLWWEVTELGE